MVQPNKKYIGKYVITVSRPITHDRAHSLRAHLQDMPSSRHIPDLFRVEYRQETEFVDTPGWGSFFVVRKFLPEDKYMFIDEGYRKKHKKKDVLELASPARKDNDDD